MVASAIIFSLWS